MSQDPLSIADAHTAPPPRRRGRPPTLSRDRVIAAAIALVEREGFDQLSLRRLAGALDSGVTSVYWHVRDKGQLLDLVIDELIGRIELPRRGRPSTQLATFARSARDVQFAYPGLAELILVRGGGGPNGVRQAEAVLAILSRSGVPDHRLLDAYHSLLVYVNGFTIATTASGARPPRDRPDAGAYVRSLPPDAIPMLVRASREPASTAEQRFDYGLRALLAGLLPP